VYQSQEPDDKTGPKNKRVPMIASPMAIPHPVATHGDLLYTQNIADVTGFRILPDGTLRAVLSSTRFLATVGGRDLGDSDIAFNPNRSFPAVTERVANQIVVFPVRVDGTKRVPVVGTNQLGQF
jgi:6-phosphogluconolactonase